MRKAQNFRSEVGQSSYPKRIHLPSNDPIAWGMTIDQLRAKMHYMRNRRIFSREPAIDYWNSLPWAFDPPEQEVSAYETGKKTAVLTPNEEKGKKV